MEGKKGIYVALVIAIILLLAALVFYFTRGISITEPSTVSNLKACNTLEFNSENGINVLFFSDRSDAEKYSDLLLSLSPFSENKEHFNFYYITPSAFDASKYCELYQGVATLCYNREVIKAASSCPHSYIAVIDNQPAHIRSSAYKDLMSINSVSPVVVFAHEFGHVFANLAEEYVPASIPFGSKNCQASCDSFQGEIDGCYEGCSRSDFTRSHEASIMRTLSSLTFGKYNERILAERIQESISEDVRTITGNPIFSFGETNCRNQRHIVVEGKKIDGEFQIESTELRTGCPSGANTIGDITYEVTDINSNELLSNQFSLNIFTDVQGEEEIKGQIYTSEQSFIITVPATGQESLLFIEDDEDGETINLEQSIGDNTACHL